MYRSDVNVILLCCQALFKNSDTFFRTLCAMSTFPEINASRLYKRYHAIATPVTTQRARVSRYTWQMPRVKMITIFTAESAGCAKRKILRGFAEFSRRPRRGKCQK